MNRNKPSGVLMALMLIASLVMVVSILGAQDSGGDGTVPLAAEATEEATPAPEVTEDPLPTAIPTGLPTEQPEVTEVPTDEPTAEPTTMPTQVPTNIPGDGGAPTILSINPPVASIDGAGYIDVIVRYEDFEGDAIGFNWTIIETDAATSSMVPGRFTQAIVGTEIPVRFNCTEPEFTMEIELVVIDAMGNESTPDTFTLICNEVVPELLPSAGGADTAAETAAEPVAVASDPGSAPVIISIEPDVAVIEGEDESTTVVVDYADADGDATRFVWLMGENDMIDYDLPAGTFDQQSVGTQIPVEFFCTRPTFEAEIYLVVEDAQGNLSESVPFTLTCDR